MARALLTVPNVDGVSADYPKGRVRDKAGATPGTTYTEVLHGDIVQFFQKLLIDAGITENGNPDNVANGYQLIDSLVDKITEKTKLDTVLTALNSATLLNSGSITVAAAAYDRNIYIRTTGVVTAGYSFNVLINGVIVGRCVELTSTMIALPKGLVATLVHAAGSGGEIYVYEQKIGV